MAGIPRNREHAMPRRPRRRHALHVLTALLVAAVAACSQPASPTITVQGQVNGYGLLGVSGVVVQAQGQTTVSDADGRFTLVGVTTPYDLVLSSAAGSGWLHAYEGLTTATPRLDPQRSDLGLGVGTLPRADVSGSIQGGPLPAGRRTVLCAEGIGVLAFGCTTVEPGRDDYLVNVAWYGPATASVRLHALRMVVGANGAPTGYEGYVTTANLSLAEGVPLMAPITLGPAPATIDAEVDVRLPSGIAVASAFVAARVSAGTSLPLAAPIALSGPFTMPVPDLHASSVTLAVASPSASGSAVAWAQAPAADLGTLTMRTAPQPLLPAAGAAGITMATAFQAAAPAGEVLTYAWTVTGGPRLALTTTRTSVTLPQLAGAGLSLPAGASVEWSLAGHGPGAVDAAVATGLLVALEFGIAGGVFAELPSSGTLATSPTRTLTLAP
jgi:hypothetical protein